MRLSLIKKSLLLGSIALLAGQAFTVDATKQLEIAEDSFDCLGAMTQVGEFFVANILGSIDETVAIASSSSGGKYPAGSMVSLIPSEVMVKHREGWNPETNDWEFFELSVAATGSKIISRGTTDVVNQFGGNCFGCHQLARPEWDLICGTDHGCAPLPLSRAQIHGIQSSDPRCAMKE